MTRDFSSAWRWFSDTVVGDTDATSAWASFVVGSLRAAMEAAVASKPEHKPEH